MSWRPLLILILLASAGPIRAGESFGPWSVEARHPVMVERAEATTPAPAKERSAALGSSPFATAYLVWSELLTRIDGPRCAHRPTCSTYAHRAVARHGAPLGLWLALNRLMRGARSSALRSLPLAAGGHGLAFVDELADNIYWRPGYAPWSGRKK